MVIEKSWNMQKWPKVCYQLLNCTNFAPELYVNFKFFVTTEKLSICVESPHFSVFSAKCHESKIEKKDGHGKLRNGH